ncbi:hypothetical protein [Enterococcus sp. DIV2438]|uniref:hypothetical protein n=1 Tax=unclassified Enterococcus TaxID=2608891 RepID=UPI003D2FE991
MHELIKEIERQLEMDRIEEGNMSAEDVLYIVKGFKRPYLNENQQIVLDWLKEDYSKNSYMSPFGTIYDTIRYREIKIRMLSKKEQAEVLQAFSQWALEQEEAE